MISFGNRIEMMVDTYLIAKQSNVGFRINPPKKGPLVYSFTLPWEGPGSLGLSVLEDGESIKLYTRGFPPEGGDDRTPKQACCLATSQDGIHFTPYPVNELDVDGYKENNVVLRNVYCHNFAPFYDTNPSCKPDERYKAIGGTNHLRTGGIHVFGSPDGIHWHELADGPVLSEGYQDSLNYAFWDSHAGVYRLYSRYWEDITNEFTYEHFNPLAKTNPLTGEHFATGGCRAIQGATSADFVHWTPSVPNQYTDGEGPTHHLYTMSTANVPGAEHHLVCMPMRFSERVRHKVKEMASAGVSDAVLMTSRDGVNWDRTVKDAWLSGTMYAHEWTQRNFVTTAGSIIERGDEFLFYVEQNYQWPDDGIWLYTLPKYRFMSLYADGNGGSFTTKQLYFESDDVYLNYATSACGHVKVTVVGEMGKVLYESDKIYGNELSHHLHFEGIKGHRGSLIVELCEAHLYAIGSKMK